MTTYVVMGRNKITASSAQEFVTKMHKEAFEAEDSDQAFMVKVANQCKLQTGDTVSTDSPENFLADLIATKYVVEGE